MGLCSTGVKIKMRKFVGGSGMLGEKEGVEWCWERWWWRGESEGIKKENEVAHYHLWSPLLPLCPLFQLPPEERHFISFGRRGVCVRVQRGDRLGVGLL